MDLYLLDDPLSAVDMHVGKHIYDNCINSLLEAKTRIVCTHHYQYLINADLVIVVDSGRIVESGTGAEVIPNYLSSRSNLDESVLDEMPGEKVKENISTIKEELVGQLKDLDTKELKKQDDEEKEQGKLNYSSYD